MAAFSPLRQGFLIFVLPLTGAPVSEPLVNRICERVFPVDMEAKDFAFPSPTGDTDHEFNSGTVNS